MPRQTAVRKAMARAKQKTASAIFREITRRERPDLRWPSWCDKAYQNNRFLVMIENECRMTAGTAIRAFIIPHNAGRQVFWSDLQGIKNQIFGEEATAIQYFPPQSRLVDVVNVYWLFVFKDGLIPAMRLEES